MIASENKAVFLSYASQDAEKVQRIAEALRAAGVEVWFLRAARTVSGFEFGVSSSEFENRNAAGV